MALRRPGPYVGLSVNYADDEKIMAAGEDAELLYIRMMAYAGRTPTTEGWISDRVLRSRLGVLPREATDEHGNVYGTVPGTDAGSRAEVLQDSGLIERDGDGWRIVSWLRWNRSAAEMGKERDDDRKRKSALTRANPETSTEHATETPTEPAPESERKDQDQDQDHSASTRNAADAAAFEEFWDTYGKKTGRKKSEAKWKLALRKPGVTSELLITAARSYIKSQVADGNHPKYTKDPATWLNGEHWNDEAAPATRRPGGVAQLRPRGQVMSDFTEDEWAALPIEERAAIADRTTMGHLT